MIAAALLHPLILILVAVLVGLVVIFAVAQFVEDPKILMIIKLIVGLIILLYGLSLFGIIA
jgi:hypothetical protein